MEEERFHLGDKPVGDSLYSHSTPMLFYAQFTSMRMSRSSSGGIFWTSLQSRTRGTHLHDHEPHPKHPTILLPPPPTRVARAGLLRPTPTVVTHNGGAIHLHCSLPLPLLLGSLRNSQRVSIRLGRSPANSFYAMPPPNSINGALLLEEPLIRVGRSSPPPYAKCLFTGCVCSR